MKSNLRISKVKIQSFRGIPHSLMLDFRPGYDDCPHSMIISGDNGTGKSSMVDAIEFALQAQIGQKKSHQSLTSSAISFATSGLPYVEIWLSDGTTTNRGFRFKGRPEHEQLRLTNRQPHQKFNISPLVLRRADILRFHEAQEHERQLVFFDYFEAPSEQKLLGTLDEQRAKLVEKRIAEKKRRRVSFSLLAEKLGVDVRRYPGNFHAFVNEHVYQGVSGGSRRGREIRRKTDPEIRNLIREIDEITKTVNQISQEIRRLKSMSNTSDPRLQELRTVLEDVESRLTDSFCHISPSTFVKQIEVSLGETTEVSLSLRAQLSNDKLCSTRQIFSEANLDLLAMLLFLAFAKESAKRGQAKVLILDDVLQSVDSTVRVSITDYILREFSDWQLVFTVHDRLWQEQLRHLFRRHGHPFVEREIVRWDFEKGPIILDSGRGIDAPLKSALDIGESSGVCSQAGLLLEAICNKLSWTLPTSVTRRKDDKYTLGDLWPGVYKVLRRTNTEGAAGKVDKWLHLRNLVGAHYNEWAQSVSTQEARLFGEAVVEMFELVRCSHCLRWIEEIHPGKVWQCRCGRTRVERV